MLSTILYFLPCLVSALWFFSFLLKEKGERQSLYTWLLAVNIIYFTSYALYISPNTNYHTMVLLDVFCVPLIPAKGALLLLYIYLLRSRSHLKIAHLLLLVPSLFIGTIVSMLYYLIGFDNAALVIELCDKGLPVPPEFQTEVYRMYNFFAEPFVDVIALILILFVVTECIKIERKNGYHLGDISSFLFKNKTSKPARIIAVLVLWDLLLLLPICFLGRRFMLQNPGVGISLTLFVAIADHLLSYVEFYSDNYQKVSLHDLSHLRIGQIEEAEESTESNSEAEMEKAAMSRRKLEAADRMKHLLEIDKVYTDENLSSTAMADMLGVGRTTFSSLVLSTYGVTFRELLNQYRVEHAKQYMIANPSATQELVASECGFKNAQYLNFKFKSIVGDTPSIWLKKQQEGPRNQDV